MTLQEPLIPELVLKNGNKVTHNIAAVFVGVIIISAVAQISISLPFTPVPITGQTFGVSLISLLWGRKRGLAAVATYLSLGFAGLPIFAFGKSGFLFGPTSGYLLGMLVASYLMGSFADKGWTRSFPRTWLAGFLGSAVTFAFGVTILSVFIPTNLLLLEGVLPFLPGDIAKTLLATIIVRQTSRFQE